MHPQNVVDEVFQEGRLAGEIGVRPEHNPFLGTDLADTWESGRQHGERNYEMLYREVDRSCRSGILLATVFATMVFIFTLTILVMMGY